MLERIDHLVGYRESGILNTNEITGKCFRKTFLSETLLFLSFLQLHEI